MIHKEVLSEVLGKEIENIGFKNNICSFILKEYDHYGEEINIYELAHKCKEWICNKGYALVITRDPPETYVEVLLKNRTVCFRISKTKTEIELIFEVCDFLYTNE